MQAVYFRPSARHQWTLVRETRSVADAEHLARQVAAEEKRGKLLYLEAMTLPTTLWDMRTLVHRRLGGWRSKELLPLYHREKQSGRIIWKRSNPRQLSLF